MAERVVKVTVQAAVANYVQGMEKVRKATADTAKESEKLERVGAASEKVGGAVLTMGAAAAGASAIVIKMAADFDAQMSKVQAATNASAADMAKFRNQALTAGSAFGYTATQVTEAQVELGKAGLATKDILGGGLNGVLALAASDNVDLGKATQIAAVAMKQFNLEGKDVPHIADELAAGAGKALGGVEQLGDALNQSGLVASNFGFSLEETTGVLSAFADAGLLGSDSGTSLKTMLQQLANPSKESAKLMKQLGINVEDSNGQFLGAADIAEVLHDKLSTLSDAQRQSALAQIFGSDAVRAATVLYKEGAKGIQAYIDQNNDAGYAVDQAARKADNLNGDLMKLKSAFQSGIVESGQAADGALRPLIQSATKLVEQFNALPEPLKAFTLGATGVVGGVGLLAGGIMVAIPKIVEFRNALATLRETGVSTRGSLGKITGMLTGPWGLAMGAGVAGIALLNIELDKLKASDAQIHNTLVTAQSAAEVYATLSKGEIASPGVDNLKTQFKDLDKVLGDFAQHNSGNFWEAIGTRFATPENFASINALRDLNEEMGKLQRADPSQGVRAFKLLADQTDGSQKSIHRLVDAIGGDYRAALADQASALGITASNTHLAQLAMGQYAKAAKDAKNPTDDNAKALADLQGSAEDATKAISDTANAIRGFNSGALDVNSTQRDLEASIDAVTDSIKDNGQSLDITTDKGRANASALDSIAQSTLNYAGALYSQTGSQDQATAALESGRSSLIAALGQYGITGQAAEDYANKILGTPTDWATLFDAQTDGAGGKIDTYKGEIGSIPTHWATTVDADTFNAQNQIDNLYARNNGRVIHFAVDAGPAARSNVGGLTKASGGYISGPGTGTSDSIPAWLSNGEYVIRESSVRKIGRPTLDRINAGHFANGGYVHPRQRYATGGAVEFLYNKRAGQYDGMQGLSQLMSIFNDSSLPAQWRADVGNAALSFQSSLTKLTDRSDAAAKKLADLRSSADSLRSSVAGAVGRYDFGGVRSTIGLKAGLARTAGNAKEFANLLTTLSKKGISGAMLAEIASLGTAEGLPLARSLAQASSSDIKSINSSYAAIQSTAASAGKTVADANFKASIAAADKNAKALASEIRQQSKAIQRIIGRSFGLPGYASGGYTGDGGRGQVAGLVHGREFVMNQAATAANRPLLEAMNRGGSVRYMDPTPMRPAAPVEPQRAPAGDRHYHLSNLDPTAFVQAVERREAAAYV